MKSARALFRFAMIASAGIVLAGCSSGNGLTTGSLFGGGESKAAAPVLKDNNTPTGRALHVGRIAGRATKCGYNFDAAALRANYLAAEAAGGLPVADLGRVERIYDSGYRGTIAATAKDDGYCTAKRTKVIKTALNKALAGDYSPPPPARQADTGVLGGIFEQDVVAEKGPGFGTGDWWDAQRDQKR
ncbi:MAG: hypothetical protein K0U74_05500 [Alphaproteobacteria bacterium]|nr:hypothetical protein [Alphaproteobacteria bacterium]